MRIFSILTTGALSMLTLAFPGPTVAVTTLAQVMAVTGARTAADLHSASGGAGGTQISAALVIPSAAGDIFISAEAASIPGALHAAGVARNGVITGRCTQAEAYAFWGDSFVISALGHDPSMTGTFTGAITVSGGLLTEPGRRNSFADVSVFGDVSFDPHAGFNSGIVSVHGEARRFAGAGIAETRLGQ